ncbi:xanthine dehydrogenase family protein molybdopterin-binding subunit [Saccharothrix coeruleofusca]|uniref:Isoquinoline 1-oxidoreductase subunit beta n=1 Tax=Saccharothrix coeruleofusca TaxID=33919 RepID=A0A918ED06_9PSEU|nr:molybdopterin cofactor-binding domain-containing protein [Saccharothrix coeruleofusca]GGP53057.1 isoquinoline 1-oxidoreductase subunit beta [Saccharothrix coeruleofusca]
MIGRRGFLAAAGLGALSVALPVPALASPTGLTPNVFVSVDRQGRVTATIPRPDSGQGVRTVVTMLIAEELAVPLHSVRVEQAPGDTARYGIQTVGGSTSVPQLADPMRRAAATARCLLLTAAAQRWRVPVDECTARDGVVHHRRKGKLPYSALVDDAAALDPTTVPVTLTPEDQWRVLGRHAHRVDARDIVTGRARYGIDTAPPGTLVAVVARPPWIGARLDTVDDTAARALPDVVDVLRLDPDTGSQGGVAVIARSTAAALAARAALKCTWTGGTPTADSRAWLTDLTAALPPAPTAPSPVALRATYSLPLLAHAPMEPMNATVHVRPDGATAWVPTQDPGNLRVTLARFLGVPTDTVRVEPTLTGGAFGRRFDFDYIAEAALCSRHTGAPVRVLWTRDDDTRHDSYRPMSVHRLQATTDATGLPTWRSHDIATWPLTVLPLPTDPSLVLVNGDHFSYSVPGTPTVVIKPAPLRTGFWRSVYAGHLAYAEEVFLSALATLGGWDQVELRKRLLTQQPRLLRVLDTAGEHHRRPRHGHTLGVACHAEYGSAIAVIAEVDARADQPRVRRVTAAVDVGRALHPSGLRAQVEGCVMDAVSTVLGAQITVREGRVVESSFRDYTWARIDRAPDIDVLIVPSDAPLGGAGELAFPPAAAAIAAAIADATGRPVTGMPSHSPVG